MVLLRLLLGLLKGLVVGGLAGFGLAKLGFAVPTVLVAYGAAALVGVLVACVAGKPIWAKGARIEVGMKALVGALLAPALLYVARRWVSFELPFDLGGTVGLESVRAPIGTFSITSYAMVAAVLAFFDADNDPRSEAASKDKPTQPGAQRVEGPSAAVVDQAELDVAGDSELAEPRKAGK
jgi:chromate transport protein ChrA